ncbi:MAG: hypothetical protein R2910_13545 [Gemmatimonadales bacterium]
MSGISGFAGYVPPYRVSLEDWCGWTGNSWEKTRAVIGDGFRMPGPDQNAYTMAAEAALRLILEHEVDPQAVGYLALGTESSTDNATSGAIVVRGLIDAALAARGLPPLARDLEAPEIKQACLGGIYGIKGALRYLQVDGDRRSAIVIASDIAEYARGSSGEPTQGAGAVAMLMEHDPKLLAIDLRRSASASRYRALDFRKPFSRYCGQEPLAGRRLHDFPVFNGKYSTACYIDETIASLDAFFARGRRGARAAYYRNLGAVFMHRPYDRMPVAAWTLGYIFALAADGATGQAELAEYAAAADVNLQALLDEMKESPDLLGQALEGDLVEEPFPLAARLARSFRAAPAYRAVVTEKMTLGSRVMRELGNLYAAALPAWLAAGLEEASEKDVDLHGKDILLIGYGSGDASEVLVATAAAGWRVAAAKSGMTAALRDPVDLDAVEYAALHDGSSAGMPLQEEVGFAIDRVGTIDTLRLQDTGIEYYRYREEGMASARTRT